MRPELKGDGKNFMEETAQESMIGHLSKTQKSSKSHGAQCCGSNSGEIVNQLIQARLMQDEQFRMMELMIDAAPTESHHHVPVVTMTNQFH